MGGEPKNLFLWGLDEQQASKLNNKTTKKKSQTPQSDFLFWLNGICPHTFSLMPFHHSANCHVNIFSLQMCWKCRMHSDRLTLPLVWIPLIALSLARVWVYGIIMVSFIEMYHLVSKSQLNPWIIGAWIWVSYDLFISGSLSFSFSLFLSLSIYVISFNHPIEWSLR